MTLTEEQQAVRAAFLEKREPQIVTVAYGGQAVDVRQPTLAERAWAYDVAAAVDGKVKFDFVALQVRAVIACACFVGTADRVFSEDDVPELSRQVVGGGVDKLAIAAVKMLAFDGSGIDRLVRRLLPRRSRK